MVEEGSSTSKGNGGLSSMDSMESHRWVFQDEDNDSDDDAHNDDDFTLHNDMDSEDEDSLFQKLIRTGPRIDSFGVEALEVPGAHRSDFESYRPTFYRIVKKKSAEEFLPDPYLACVMNCLLWIFYGIPINHPNSTLVITINGTGLVLEIIYLTIFLIYGTKKHRVKIAILLLIEIIFLAVIASLDLTLFHTHSRRSTFVGIFCVVFGVIMYVSPITVMFKVIKTKSVEFMPFTLSLAGFLNGCCWTTYALLKFDINILIANGTGAVLGFTQLILYGCYWSTTPKKNKMPPAEVQLEKVQIE